MKQPIAGGNTNKGCRKTSVQRSGGKDRLLNVVLSLFHKLENNRIGLWWRTLVFFPPVISFVVSHSPRQSAADSKGRRALAVHLVFWFFGSSVIYTQRAPSSLTGTMVLLILSSLILSSLRLPPARLPGCWAGRSNAPPPSVPWCCQPGQMHTQPGTCGPSYLIQDIAKALTPCDFHSDRWSPRRWAVERSLLAGRSGSRVTLAVGWTCGRVPLTHRMQGLGIWVLDYLAEIASEPFWQFQIILLINCLNNFGQLGLWGKNPNHKTQLPFSCFLNEHPLLEQEGRLELA